MLKKIIFAIIVSLSLLTFFRVNAVKAQSATDTATDTLTSTFSNYPIEKLWQKYCDDRKGDVINLQTWYSGKCTTDPTDPQAIGFSDIVLLDFYTLLQGEPGTSIGALSMVGKGVTALYSNPPASFGNYVAYVKDNMSKHSIVQPVYAQTTGYGFQALSPVLPLWRGFRNIVYALFILVFVFYGFMIMFRFKISPQAVTTIQLALPQIAITLILVAFSYAIAGLLIELMYVVLGLIMAILAGGGFIGSYIQQHWSIGDVSLLEIFLRFILHAILGLVNNLIIALTGLSGVLLDAANLVAAGVFGIFFAIFILLVAIYVLFKVFLMLLGAMVNVLLLTIFSPFILLMGVIPGNKSFSDWVKNIVSNLAVFPAVITMFAFAFIFLGDYQVNVPIIGSLNVPVLSEDFNLPIEEGGVISFPIIGASREAKAVLALIGFGFFLLTPKVGEEMKKFFGATGVGFGSALTEPLKFGYTTAPENISGATGGLGYGLNRMYQYGRSRIQRVPGLSSKQQAPTNNANP